MSENNIKVGDEILHECYGRVRKCRIIKVGAKGNAAVFVVSNIQDGTIREMKITAEQVAEDLAWAKNPVHPTTGKPIQVIQHPAPPVPADVVDAPKAETVPAKDQDDAKVKVLAPKAKARRPKTPGELTEQSVKAAVKGAKARAAKKAEPKAKRRSIQQACGEAFVKKTGSPEALVKSIQSKFPKSKFDAKRHVPFYAAKFRKGDLAYDGKQGSIAWLPSAAEKREVKAGS